MGDELHQQTLALARMAREEDLGEGDLTSAIMPDADRPGEFTLVARQRGILAGRSIAADVLGVYSRDIQIDWRADATDGAHIGEGDERIATIRGPVCGVLSAERVLLNFLQRTCGIATLTRAYVDAVAGTTAKIYDTRKTTPGWRVLEKYAVRCGGGFNHRMGLHDAILIKDNHLSGVPTSRLASLVFEMLNCAAASNHAPAFIEVEADTLEQVKVLFTVVGIDIILLDNFSIADLTRAVTLRDNAGLQGKVDLEASGGVNLETVGPIAQTGVNRISVGALTHSAPALDLALGA